MSKKDNICEVPGCTLIAVDKYCFYHKKLMGSSPAPKKKEVKKKASKK